MVMITRVESVKNHIKQTKDVECPHFLLSHLAFASKPLEKKKFNHPAGNFYDTLGPAETLQQWKMKVTEGALVQ